MQLALISCWVHNTRITEPEIKDLTVYQLPKQPKIKSELMCAYYMPQTAHVTSNILGSWAPSLEQF